VSEYRDLGFLEHDLRSLRMIMILENDRVAEAWFILLKNDCVLGTSFVLLHGHVLDAWLVYIHII
jgi:hypothetical protein